MQTTGYSDHMENVNIQNIFHRRSWNTLKIAKLYT